MVMVTELLTTSLYASLPALLAVIVTVPAFVAVRVLPYDETDESYTVIDGPSYAYHDHVPSLYVFAPHYHVPLYLQKLPAAHFLFISLFHNLFLYLSTDYQYSQR